MTVKIPNKLKKKKAEQQTLTEIKPQIQRGVHRSNPIKHLSLKKSNPNRNFKKKTLAMARNRKKRMKERDKNVTGFNVQCCRERN